MTRKRGSRPPRRTIGPLELRFVEKYVETLSVERAYKFAADYHGELGARMGLKWLARPEIQAAIEVRQHEVAAEMKVTPQEIVRRMMLIGYANPQHLVDEAGAYLGLRQLSEDTALALASVKVLSKRTIAAGEDRVEFKVLEYKFWNKPAMLDSLANYLNLFKGLKKASALEDLSVEELELLEKANEAAYAAIVHAQASSAKVMNRAVAKVTADVMAEEEQKAAKGANGKGNGKTNGKGGNGHSH